MLLLIVLVSNLIRFLVYSSVSRNIASSWPCIFSTNIMPEVPVPQIRPVWSSFRFWNCPSPGCSAWRHRDIWSGICRPHRGTPFPMTAAETQSIKHNIFNTTTKNNSSHDLIDYEFIVGSRQVGVRPRIDPRRTIEPISIEFKMNWLKIRGAFVYLRFLIHFNISTNLFVQLYHPGSLRHFAVFIFVLFVWFFFISINHWVLTLQSIWFKSFLSVPLENGLKNLDAHFLYVRIESKQCARTRRQTEGVIIMKWYGWN